MNHLPRPLALVLLAALVALALDGPAAAIRHDDPPRSTNDCRGTGPDRQGVWDVRLVYIHALERCPTIDEELYWVERQEDGMTRLQLAESIDRSNESLEQIVVETFDRAHLRRPPTDDELATSYRSLRTTRSFTGLLVATLASDEFLLSNEIAPGPQWVEAVFPLVLGRTADEGAVSYYSSAYALDTVAGRARVVTLVLRSAEMRRLWVTQSYVAILGRQPDATGLAYWDGWLRTGRGLDRTLQLRSLLLASAEAHAIATCPVTC